MIDETKLDSNVVATVTKSKLVKQTTKSDLQISSFENSTLGITEKKRQFTKQVKLEHDKYIGCSLAR